MLPPPVGEPPRAFDGIGATPNENLALVRTLVRLPVVVHMIVVLVAQKSFGVVPQSMMPFGITPSFWLRSAKNCAAATTLGSSYATLVPSRLARIAPFWVVSAWNSQ